MKLNLVVEFPSDFFGPWSSDKVGHAEASSMGNRHLQRIYDDAADLGFEVRSTKTGKVVLYVLEEEVREEGEILGWKFTPSFESQRDIPECVGTKIIVYND